MKRIVTLLLVSGVAVLFGLTTSRAQLGQCGNGIVDSGEECDPAGSISCPPGSPQGAFLACNQDCTCPAQSLEDHFKCYDDVQVTPKFTPVPVALTDQFGSTSGASVLKARRFCNPVDKNGEGIQDVTGHLSCYKLKRGNTARKNLKMTNQFGEQLVTTVRAAQLCVPSEKNGVPLSSAAGAFLNHFQCYKVRRTQGAGHFLGATVSLSDQFESGSVKLPRPDLVCNPVDKNGEGIPQPENHLTCFRIKGGPSPVSRTITSADQLGERTIKIRRAVALCVPSTKTVLP